MNKTVGEYKLVELLGRGSYAEVYKATKQGESTEYAVKIIPRHKLTPKLQENLGAEIAIMRDFRHPNIVRLFEILKTENNIYLVLEYCAGGDLHKYIHKKGRLPESVAQVFLRQLVEGLRFLGSKNLIHRDIKPQNLLLSHEGDDATIKIADFGFARHLASADLAQTLCGTPLYMAPEIMQYKQYDAKADLWSVGAVLYEMITGRPPFTGENQAELFRNIQTKALRIPRDLTVSPEIVEVLQHLLERNPLRRASLEALCRLAFVNLPEVEEAKEETGAEEMKLGTSPLPPTHLASSSPLRTSPTAELMGDTKPMPMPMQTSGLKDVPADRMQMKSGPTHIRTGSSPGHVRTFSRTPSAITTMMMAAAAATGSGSSGSPLPATSMLHQAHSPPTQQQQPQQHSPPDSHQLLATSVNLGGSTHAPGKGVPIPRTNPFKSPEAAPGGSALRSSHSQSPSHSTHSLTAAHAAVSESMAQTREWVNDRAAPHAARLKQPEEVQTSTGSDDFVLVESGSQALTAGLRNDVVVDTRRPLGIADTSMDDETSQLRMVVHQAESLANYAVAITAAADRLIRAALTQAQQDIIKLPLQAALTLYMHSMFLLKRGITAVQSAHQSLHDAALKPLLKVLTQRFESVLSRAERSRERLTASGTFDPAEMRTPEEIMYTLSMRYAQDATANAVLGDYTVAIDNYQTAKSLMEAAIMRTQDPTDRKTMTQCVEKFAQEIQACQMAVSRQTDGSVTPEAKTLFEQMSGSPAAHPQFAAPIHGGIPVQPL